MFLISDVWWYMYPIGRNPSLTSESHKCRHPSGPSLTSGASEQTAKGATMYMFMNIEYNTCIFYSMFHTSAPWHFDISVTYPKGFHRFKFVIIPPCFIWQQYLWNIVIHVQAAHRLGKNNCENRTTAHLLHNEKESSWIFVVNSWPNILEDNNHDTPLHTSDHLSQILNESIKNCILLQSRQNKMCHILTVFVEIHGQMTLKISVKVKKTNIYDTLCRACYQCNSINQFTGTRQ